MFQIVKHVFSQQGYSKVREFEDEIPRNIFFFGLKEQSSFGPKKISLRGPFQPPRPRVKGLWRSPNRQSAYSEVMVSSHPEIRRQ
jgi:hypothetical protein